jgi:hypothetical protein
MGTVDIAGPGFNCFIDPLFFFLSARYFYYMISFSDESHRNNASQRMSGPGMYT